MSKVVISREHGNGLSLSAAARARMAEFGIADVHQSGKNIARDDPRLVAVVEELGWAAHDDTKFCLPLVPGTDNLPLIVVETDAEWIVAVYDGIEAVIELTGQRRILRGPGNRETVLTPGGIYENLGA